MIVIESPATSMNLLVENMKNNMRKYPKEIRESRLYRIWNNMKCRCYTKSSGVYAKYGAKGISVCDEWKTDFMAFYNWALANGYSDDLQIDRIDFRGNYEPSNCRWVNLVEQANNKSNVVKLSYNGEEHTISEWSTITGIKALNIWQRINVLGWSIEKALTVPERFIDNTRTEADTRIIKREIRRAACEHTCEHCKQIIKTGETHPLLHISKDYVIHSLRLHFSCEDAFVSMVNKECGRDADKRWEIIKQRSIDKLNARKEE